MKNEKWKVKSEKCSQANELGYVVKSEEWRMKSVAKRMSLGMWWKVKSEKCNQQIPNTSVVSHM